MPDPRPTTGKLGPGEYRGADPRGIEVTSQQHIFTHLSSLYLLILS